MIRAGKTWLRFVVLVMVLVSAAAIVGTEDPGAVSRVRSEAAQPVGVDLVGLDAHDGTIYRDGDDLWMVGTRYGCGYQWQGGPNYPFCGFGLWHSTVATGLSSWSYQGLLFDPVGINTVRGETWNITCNYGGNGCFNPRLTKRHDGVWLLYFNAPAETLRGQSAGYYLMGCNAPAPGACGAAAGAPHGSTYRMPMGACRMGGDFTIVNDGPTAYIACSGGTITVEQLDVWWANGIATTTFGAVRSIAYLTNVESPGVWKDPTTGMWVMSFSDPQCGYCSGTGTGYIVAQAGLTDTSPATGPLGVWLGPTNVGYGQPINGRRLVSGSSCGGQPRTVFVIDGQPWQWIDTWNGQLNETSAGVRLEPLVRTGAQWRAPADGSTWPGAFTPFGCQ